MGSEDDPLPETTAQDGIKTEEIVTEKAPAEDAVSQVKDDPSQKTSAQTQDALEKPYELYKAKDNDYNPLKPYSEENEMTSSPSHLAERVPKVTMTAAE